MTNKFYMVIRETGTQRHRTKDDAIADAVRLSRKNNDGYFVMEVVGLVAPDVAPVLYTEI